MGTNAAYPGMGNNAAYSKTGPKAASGTEAQTLDAADGTLS